MNAFFFNKNNMLSVWSNEWYISDHFSEMFYFVQANVLINKAAHFCFSSCEADRYNHPWTQIHGFLFFCSSPSVTSSGDPSDLCPEGIKGQSSACASWSNSSSSWPSKLIPYAKIHNTATNMMWNNINIIEQHASRKPDSVLSEGLHWHTRNLSNQIFYWNSIFF